MQKSRDEVNKVYAYYHNEQYTQSQLAKIKSNRQPAETYNVIKMYGRLLLGYYQTVINDIKVIARKYSDLTTAGVLNDLVTYVLDTNNFKSEADRLKLDLILSGVMCCYETVEPTGEKDQFGRPKYKILLQHVPVQELVLDPMSKLGDYSDAKYIHRFKWISKEDVEISFGQDKLEKLIAYDNHLGIPDASFEKIYNKQFQGKWKLHDNYLIVHSIIKDGDKSWSIFWSKDVILDKKEITFRAVKNPYRIQKLYDGYGSEYYGIFREVLSSQDAVNQAILKIQKMVNTEKAIVEESAVRNMEEFRNQYERVNAIIPVERLTGINIINMNQQIADQYNIIDKALERIQRILGINDSFLGLAYSGDSGKKVQIQQQASITSLKYLSTKIENFYRMLGRDVMQLIQQYFIASDVVSIADDIVAQRWVEINAPFLAKDKKGNPKYLLEEVVDPDTGEPLTTEDGNILLAPIPSHDTDISFTDAEIRVDSVAYNDDREQSQLLLDSLVNGSSGQFLMQTNPAGFAQLVALSVKNMKLQVSPEIIKIYEQTGQLIQQQQQSMAQQPMAQQPMGGQAMGQQIPDGGLPQ